MEDLEEFRTNKVILHPAFYDTIHEINKINVSFPYTPQLQEINYDIFSGISGGKLANIEEGLRVYDLNEKSGEKQCKENIFYSGYDESILKYVALEGVAYFTSHSLVIASKDEYVPANYLTFYFYTRSKNIIEHSKFIRYVQDVELESKRDYMKDKIDFLKEYSPSRTILFVDGPLIGGDLYTYMIQAIEDFLEKEVVPVFFVKNSDSNLVTDNIKELIGAYNSDMHWSYNFLKNGQRTNFFQYTDRKNPRNAKIFCYIKAYDISPQRIEFHIDTFRKYKDILVKVMDLIYYLLLVHGNKKNSQLRPIAIAEKYARETLKLINIYQLMKNSGLIPTMNQERFGG